MWYKDLITLMKEKQEKGGVIVVGDFNEDLNDEKSKINLIMKDNGRRPFFCCQGAVELPSQVKVKEQRKVQAQGLQFLCCVITVMWLVK